MHRLTVTMREILFFISHVEREKKKTPAAGAMQGHATACYGTAGTSLFSTLFQRHLYRNGCSLQRFAFD